MRMEFQCEVKNPDGFYPYVNVAIFRMPTGEEIEVDRETTLWTFNGNHLSMEWRNCYIWDEDGAHFDFPPEFKEARFLRFEIEEESDVPEGYDIIARGISCS